MRYLVEISIGPVQGFIAQSRRLRDLWYSSWLLSELSKAAALALSKPVGFKPANLIFPSSDADLTPRSRTSVANKVVADFTGTESELNNLITQAKEAIQTRLQGEWDAIKDILPGIDVDVAQRQIADFLECTWVALPLVHEDAYARTRKKLERLHAAVKATRTFTQPSWISSHPKPKSSLDGERESVLPQNAGESQKTYEHGIRVGEELSAIDLLKRLGTLDGERQYFPSTTHMATIPFLAQLAQQQSDALKTAWERYRHLLDTHYPDILKQERVSGENTSKNVFRLAKPPFWGDADGSLFVPERVEEEITQITKSRGQARSADVVKQILGALEAFYRVVEDETHLPRPKPYYAILVADGDNMGAAIDHLAEGGNGIGNHRAFSQKLGEFAQQARDIIRKHQGAPIYTGGDDVLAFLPLHQALLCARELADSFHTAFVSLADGLTLSAGLAIVHRLEPLSEALDLARKAEKKAKKYVGERGKKNALTVSLRKRSGPPLRVTGHWGTIDKQLQQFSDWLYAGQLPDGFAYELRTLANRFTGQDTSTGQPLLKAEAIRILKRKEADEQVVGAISEILPESKKGLAAIADHLLIARMLADATYQPVVKGATE